MRFPPKIIRRLILDPIIVVLAALVVWFWPFVVLGVLALAIIPRVGRITRVLSVVLLYIVLEGLAVTALFALWIASGFGVALRTPAFQHAHYRLIAWVLRVLFRFATWALRLRIVYSGGAPGTSTAQVPLIVAARHAGPGDSFILINALLNDFSRYPRIVMKDTLQWDPMIDIVMNRLPMVFLSPAPFDHARVDDAGDRSRMRVAELASGMTARDALVIFPEGGNFSVRRRASHIRQLFESGNTEYADRAERLLHVLAPRPGGLFAAVDANPDAGLTFVGHTGLEKFDSLRELWRGLPTHKVLVMRSWYVAPDEIPHGWEARQAWLFDWWARVDEWIDTTDVESYEPQRKQKAT